MKKYTPTKKSEFKSCLYCIKNESSGEVLEIKTKWQKLKPIEKTLSQEDVSNFIEKLLDAEMINDSFHNTHGILFEIIMDTQRLKRKLSFSYSAMDRLTDLTLKESKQQEDWSNITRDRV